MPPDEFSPAQEARWLAKQRKTVEGYLKREEVSHGGLEEEPKWRQPPYVALWFAKPKPKKKSARGIWIISGDLPTDYVSAVDVEDAREALRAFSARWERLAGEMLAGEKDPEFKVGPSDDPEKQKELGDLLLRRSKALGEWAEDASLW